MTALGSQGSLRALLNANAAGVGELAPRTVLRRLAVASRDLVGARYAAFGVLGVDGTFEDFLHVGIDEDHAAGIGPQPQGLGILGLMTIDPEAVRLRDLTDHPAAVGFPTGHPLMGSFLGVPVRVRSKHFGNLYLTESERGEFTVEDEALVVALAGSAGVAIENGRLYDETQRRRRWQAVTTRATHQLISGAHEQPLEVLVHLAAEAADGDFALLVREVDGQPVLETVVGALGEEVAGWEHLAGGGAAESVLGSGDPILVVGGSPSPDGATAAVGVGSLIAVPLVKNGLVVAAIVVGRVPGRQPFDQIDLGQLGVFAIHAGVAVELAQTRADSESLLVQQEHERIAADLHDHVIQELFATGMGLQSMAGTSRDSSHRERLLGYVEAIDATIQRIRNTVFTIGRPDQAMRSLKSDLHRIGAELHPALGFPADFEFSGPLDHPVSHELANDVVAVAREALSNVARHARATSVQVRVGIGAGVLALEVNDDGCGLGTPQHSSGLTNMWIRAARHGGALDFLEATRAGCRLRWTALLEGNHR